MSCSRVTWAPPGSGSGTGRRALLEQENVMFTTYAIVAGRSLVAGRDRVQERAVERPAAGKCHVHGSRGPRRHQVQERALRRSWSRQNVV
jgi:hypothetical protein